MKFGMLHLFESPEGRSEHELIGEQLDLMQAAEPMGFDSIWPAEHHFTEYGYCVSTARPWPPSRARPSVSAWGRAWWCSPSTTPSAWPKSSPSWTTSAKAASTSASAAATSLSSSQASAWTRRSPAPCPRRRWRSSSRPGCRTVYLPRPALHRRGRLRPPPTAAEAPPAHLDRRRQTQHLRDGRTPGLQPLVLPGLHPDVRPVVRKDGLPFRIEIALPL